MFGGPGVNICSDCVQVCDQIIDEEGLRAPYDPTESLESRLVRARGHLERQLGRRPTVSEFAAEIGADEDQAFVETLRRLAPSRDPSENPTGPGFASLLLEVRGLRAQLGDLCDRLAELVDGQSPPTD